FFKYQNMSFTSPSPVLSFLVTNNTYRVKSVFCQNNVPNVDVFVGVCMFVVILFIIMTISGTIFITIKEWKKKSAGNKLKDSLSLAHKHYGTVSFYKINGQQLQVNTPKSKFDSPEHNPMETTENNNGVDKRVWECSSTAEHGIAPAITITRADFFNWILTSFAIQNSVPALFRAKNTVRSYSVINGIRVLSLLWIISGHVCHFILFNNLDNPVQWLVSVPNNVLYIFSLGGPFYLAVDSLFLISGLLSARTLLNMHHQPEKGLTFKILKDYVIRRLQ
ncbi:O-acyltransferase like protein-like, partial [Rhincodon typus]|uniref:O-acyltransferase like protein-like n=1 Tax=Rhincodon typus TaxID=259920 RepID=UPI00202E6FE6